MKLLVYAANLHVGGGVQVATSLILELSKRSGDVRELTIWASSTVDANLQGLDFDASVFEHYEVIDHRGVWARCSADRHRLSVFEGILVIFGPHYFGSLAPVVVMGFAQAWIISRVSEIYDLMPPLQRWRTRAKYFLQGLLFRRADWLVVELDHVRQGLIRCGIGNPERITVIPNCISSVYLTPSLWQKVALPPLGARFRLGFIGRNYLHKNTRVFPEVLDLLRQRHGLDVELLVTFTPAEWSACDAEFRSRVVNVGELSMAQCPAYYQSLDAVIFPSLLECFSATPLEALVMERPLFASDRAFVRDVCGDFAEYFDPLNPEDIARVIASGLLQPLDPVRQALAKHHAIDFSNAGDRVQRYLTLLREACAHTNRN